MTDPFQPVQREAAGLFTRARKAFSTALSTFVASVTTSIGALATSGDLSVESALVALGASAALALGGFGVTYASKANEPYAPVSPGQGPAAGDPQAPPGDLTGDPSAPPPVDV